MFFEIFDIDFIEFWHCVPFHRPIMISCPKPFRNIFGYKCNLENICYYWKGRHKCKYRQPYSNRGDAFWDGANGELSIFICIAANLEYVIQKSKKCCQWERRREKCNITELINWSSNIILRVVQTHAILSLRSMRRETDSIQFFPTLIKN